MSVMDSIEERYEDEIERLKDKFKKSESQIEILAAKYREERNNDMDEYYLLVAEIDKLKAEKTKLKINLQLAETDKATLNNEVLRLSAELDRLTFWIGKYRLG